MTTQKPATPTKAARRMWWALNSLIPCVPPHHKREILAARKAMKEWLKLDPNIGDASL